jgi:hypothetical protein
MFHAQETRPDFMTSVSKAHLRIFTLVSGKAIYRHSTQQQRLLELLVTAVIRGSKSIFRHMECKCAGIYHCALLIESI